MADVKVETAALRRTQQERRAATRAALLVAAADAVDEMGPAASVADIARRAGVSTGALQHHFETKADLLVEVVRVGWDDLVERSMQIDRSTPPRDRVVELVYAVWESYRRPESRAAFLISSDPSLDPAIRRRLGPVYEEVGERLDALWLDVFSDLALPVERVALARRFARSHLGGMAIQRHITTGEPEPDEELDLLIQMTLEILTEWRR